MFERQSFFELLPDVSLEVQQENLNLFFETMKERQLIWKRRFIDKKERPWTENKIFQEYKFTNVYRELDRNSQWLIKNIILDDSLDLKNMVWKMMVFRYFNHPETFMLKTSNDIPNYNEYNEEDFTNFIAEVRQAGINPFTTAYLIYSGSGVGCKRDDYYTKKAIPMLYDKLDEIIQVAGTAERPEEIIACLNKLPGVSNFIAHEFYQDFTYVDRYTNKHLMKFDQNDYTNVGPGASLGIRLIFPNLTYKEQKSGIYKLKEMAEEKLKSVVVDEKFPFLYWDKSKREYYIGEECNITLHQIEMWLCEFQKYWKMSIKKGKQRSKFTPKTLTL
jgi:hypothetical protein